MDKSSAPFRGGTRAAGAGVAFFLEASEMLKDGKASTDATSGARVEAPPFRFVVWGRPTVAMDVDELLRVEEDAA